MDGTFAVDRTGEDLGDNPTALAGLAGFDSQEFPAMVAEFNL